MKKASDLYELSRRELLLLELFNRIDDDEQKQKLTGFIGYLMGRGILSEDESFEYLKEIKGKD